MATNGESQPHSVFFSHLGSLPVVSDGVTYFKGTHTGKSPSPCPNPPTTLSSSPSLHTSSRRTHTPGPTSTKPDQIADSGLAKLEERVPLVKEPTEKLRERITSLPVITSAQDALAFGNQKKEYAFKVYNEEYNKTSNGQKSLIFTAKAGVTTSYILTTETLGWLSSYLFAKKEEVKEVVNEKVSE